MSVSHTGSIGSRILIAFRLSSFCESLGTSNPLEPSRMDLHDVFKQVHTIYFWTVITAGKVEDIIIDVGVTQE